MTVIRLLDRGSTRAVDVITDVVIFGLALAENLLDEAKRGGEVSDRS